MSLLAPGRNLVLIGMMGSGKSTVGRLLAARLGRGFIDTDEVIEVEAGRSVAEVFATEGERGFRAREAACVRWVSALRGQIVAVGGGAVLDPANVTQLRSTGDLVLLDAPPSTLAERLGGEDAARRPLIADNDALARLTALAEDRAPAYAAATAHRIDTAGRSAEEVADAVLDWARAVPGLLSREERQTWR